MAQEPEVLIDWHGGTAVGIKLRKHNCIVLGTDLKLAKTVLQPQANEKKKKVKTVYGQKAYRKLFFLYKKIACAHVGLRVGLDGALEWLKSVKNKSKKNSTFAECHQFFEDHRQERFHNQPKESVEIILAGWDDDEPKLIFWHNSGFLDVSSAYTTGKGRNASWGNLVNTGIVSQELDVEEAVSLVERTIYKASLSDNSTGFGSEVIILRRGKDVHACQIIRNSQEELEEKYGAKEGEASTPTEEDWARWGFVAAN